MKTEALKRMFYNMWLMNAKKRISKADTGKIRKTVVLGLFVCFQLLPFLMAGCGDSSSEPNIIEPDTLATLFPYGEIALRGENSVESNLAITSDNNTAAAVSVTRGGELTLSDSTIVKTASTASLRSTETKATDDDTHVPPSSEIGTVQTSVQPVEDPGPSGPAKPASTVQPVVDPGAQAAAGQVMHGGGGEFSDEYDTPPAGKPGEDPGPLGPGGPTAPPAEVIKVDSGDSSTDGTIGSKTSGVFAGSKGKVALSNVTIATNLENGYGLCSVGDGSSITLTSGDVLTSGNSSQGLFVSNSGSAFIKDATIKAIEASAVSSDGGAIVLENTSLWSGSKSAVILYNRDSEAKSETEFEMSGGEVASDGKPIFQVSNIHVIINLKGVKVSESVDTFLKVSEPDVGQSINSGYVNLVADNQIIPGDIIVDKDCSLTVTTKNNSVLKGSINKINTGKKVDLTLDNSSTWDVTADSYLGELTLSKESLGDTIPNIKGNGHTVFYNKELSIALGGRTYELAKGGSLQPK